VASAAATAGAYEIRTPSLGVQVALLAQRSIAQTVRQPAQIIPAIVFPLLLFAINAAGLDAADQLPGFPATYLDFALAVPFVQGALFAALNSGTALALDVQTGFLSRLSMTPLRRSALIAGTLGGAALLGVVQAIVFIAVGLIVGAGIASGPLGVVAIVIYSLFSCIAFAALGSWAALRAGSGEAMQGLFPLFFGLLFFSSMAMPRNVISEDWFRIVATINPVSYLLEGVRSLIIIGWDPEALALGCGVIALMLLVGLAGAGRALRKRMERT
jgi:ABC-2 type transport system permease protein